MRYFDGVRWASVATFEERAPHPTLPLRAAVGALVILLVSLLVGRSLVDELVRFHWPVIVYVVLLVVIGYGPSLAWVAYVRRRWGAGRVAEVGWQFRWIDLGWGPVTWLAAIGTQIAVAAIVLAFDIPLSSNVDDVSELGVDRAYLVATVIAAVVAAPIVEELVFRGVVMRGFLARMAPVAAIGLQGVLFGVAHVDPVRGLGNIGLAIILSAVGCAFGTAAYLTRRVGPTVIAHAIFNGVVMLIVLTGVLDGADRDLGAAASGMVSVLGRLVGLS
jgi:membrane protease YdiL (CAAX protease family)